MSQANVEIVRRLFEAVAFRDSKTPFSLYHPDVEFDGRRHRWAELLGAADSVVHGHEGLRRWARNYYSAWDNHDDGVEV